jgi:hypothetical protein
MTVNTPQMIFETNANFRSIALDDRKLIVEADQQPSSTVN